MGKGILVFERMAQRHVDSELSLVPITRALAGERIRNTRFINAARLSGLILAWLIDSLFRSVQQVYLGPPWWIYAVWTPPSASDDRTWLTILPQSAPVGCGGEELRHAVEQGDQRSGNLGRCLDAHPTVTGALDTQGREERRWRSGVER